MAAAVTRARSDYDAFAPYYDAFTASSDYEAWTRALLAVAARHGIRGDRVLDLACGTGKSFAGFLEHGFRVTGCDCVRPTGYREGDEADGDADGAV
jgi:ubiquinone/menaquinone biosynthesis C-methylase UbiE